VAVLKIDLVSDLKDKGFKEAESSMGKLGSAANTAALAIGAGLVAGAVKAVDAASDLAESSNAVAKVFEKSAGTISDFGDQAAETVGLSKREFNELATSTGSLLKNFGMSTDKAADSTVELAKRAADMASVFNTDVGTALNAINSGLRGEAEPLRAFGVSLSDATVKAKAMEMGLYSGTGALDEQAKAAATMALIMDQTASVQGDFADTSGGAANAQRILKAEMENVTAELGSALLPVVEEGVGLLRTFAEWAGENTTVIKVLVGVLAAFAGAVLAVNVASKAFAAAQAVVQGATMAWTAAQWLLNAALTANPIGLVVVAIGALIAAGVLLVTNWETVKAAFVAVWDWIKSHWDLLLPILTGPIGLAVVAIVDNFDKIKATADRVFDAVVGAVKKVVGPFDDLIGKIRSVIDWIGKIKFPEPPGWMKSIGGAIGSINPFLVPAPGSITPHAALTATGTAAASPSIVVNVNGALDPDAVARQIERILRTRSRRVGGVGQLATGIR
jgi:hypothetical protein